MARRCDICGKGLRFGNVIRRRGLPKSKGGIGLHTTGINHRVFRPNLQKVRVRTGGGVVVRRVCARCLKAGKVQKA